MANEWYKTHCMNCKEELVEESELEQRLHERCKPNPEEQEKLEKLAKDIGEVWGDGEANWGYLFESIIRIENGIVTDMNFGEIDEVPVSYAQFSGLKRLTFWRCTPVDNFDSLKQLTELEQFYLTLDYLLKEVEYNSLMNSLMKLNKLDVIDLGDCNITDISKLMGLQNLRSLDLHNNRLTQLPESIGQLQNLEYLDLSNNQLITLPESIGQLKKLKHLDLIENQLLALPDSLGQLKNIEKLFIYDNNDLTTIPESLRQLKKLKPIIDLSLGPTYFPLHPKWEEIIWKEITHVSIIIDCFSNGPLPIYTYEKNSLTIQQTELLNNDVLEKLTEKLTQLKTLTLEQLTHELPIIQSFRNVKNLTISTQFNNLNILNLGQFTNLESLKIKYPNYNEKHQNFRRRDLTTREKEIPLFATIFTMPEELGQLKNLKKLIIEDSDIKVLPEAIGQLTNLIELKLSYNQLSDLPKSFSRLINLRSLNLDSNNFESIPYCIFELKNHGNLNDISFSDSKNLFKTQHCRVCYERTEDELEQLQGRHFKCMPRPKEIDGKTTEFQKEELIERLERVLNPEELNKVKKLVNVVKNIDFKIENGFIEYLYLKPTADLNFFELITNFTHLRELNISNNYLGKLPDLFDIFDKLLNLEKLNLNNNRLTTLPDSIGQLANLKELKLRYNQLSDLPKSFNLLTNLRSLELDSNNFETIPYCIFELKKHGNLKNISFSNNKNLFKSDRCDNCQEKIEDELEQYQRRHLKCIPNPEEKVKLNALNNYLVNFYNNKNNIQTTNEATSNHKFNDSFVGFQVENGLVSNLSCSLGASQTPLEIFPDPITHFSGLKKLSFEHFTHLNNEIESLPEKLFNLDLIELDLNRNHLLEISESIGKLENLTSLSLYDNRLKTLPKSIGLLKNLKYLWVENNKLIELPESMGQLISLEILNVTGNLLTSLPDSIWQLENLKELFISDNFLSKLPETLGQLKNLKSLFIGNNELTELPEALWNLKNLEYLSLSGLPLFVIPKSLRQLKNLKGLLIGNNDELSELPEALWDLKNLENLDLSGLYLYELPKSLGQLKNLNRLTIENNDLTEIPETIGNLEKLEWLYLKQNQLSTLPETIGNLVNLKSLELSINRLSTLPETMRNLVKLGWLDLSRNQITSIPEEIKYLVELHELNLGQNQLEKIPDAISELLHLNVLILNDNELSSLPESIKRLKYLYALDLRNNNFDTIPPCALELWKRGSLDQIILSGNKIPQDLVKKYETKNPHVIKHPPYKWQ